MNWKLKAIIQGGLARVPWGAKVNNTLQKIAGGRTNISQYIGSKVKDDWLVHMSHLNRLGFTVQERDMMEIGTGWLPVMPLCFSLSGVRNCYTLDLNRHLKMKDVHVVLGHLEPYLEVIATAAGNSFEQVRHQWNSLMSLRNGEEILSAAAIEYHAPSDATNSRLKSASIDLVFSNSVLEHVPAEILDRIMCESQRVLKPGGVSLHNVNCGDHYAYFDRSITPINYLRFPEHKWRWWNNNLLYQNRLRPVDFVESAHRAGLEVVLDTHRPQPELLHRFAELPIAEEFSHYSADQICCTSIDFAALRN